MIAELYDGEPPDSLSARIEQAFTAPVLSPYELHERQDQLLDLRRDSNPEVLRAASAA